MCYTWQQQCQGISFEVQMNNFMCQCVCMYHYMYYIYIYVHVGVCGCMYVCVTVRE